MPSIKQKIEKEIESGEVKMEPRSSFVFKNVILIVAIVLAIILAVFYASMAIFALRAGGIIFLPYLGLSLIPLIFLYLPWELIFIIAVLVILIELLAKRYPYFYKHSPLFTIGAIALVLLVAGIALALSGVHERLSGAGVGRGPGFAGPGYERMEHMRPEGLFIGKITAIDGNDITVKLENGDEAKVVTNDETRGITNLKIGEVISVIGEYNDSTINADAIRPIRGRGFFGKDISRKAPPCDDCGEI
ncbi:hypothetical protein A2215_03670 [Candidatus Berkelbacteria bacterium RIFOXYA2_FULL_43_10]|uniref:DUF5666 domain-containing protein n=1 Tax=Candidatus Berkelbacteria bacterium RIFOXYA2_FULL_43_10 TaxID=1797472 RepID=A0A1F5E4L4_9BACT|nr:MAG: hypothetical protein A2215_03670 [Candidatus Berkelbacteria bacterium RIFOXYA2_FULL_43_10]